MVNFLFWNVGGNPRDRLIAELAHEYDVDVLMLAECISEVGNLLLALNDINAEYRYMPRHKCSKIEIYTRFDERLILPIVEGDRFTIRILALPDSEEVLLVVTHA